MKRYIPDSTPIYLSGESTPEPTTCVVLGRDHERIVAELRAEVERLKRANQVVPKDAELLALNGKFRDTIATQKRVIERFRQSINDLIIYVDSDADSFGDRYWSTRNTLIAMLKETTAIEKGEA